VFLCLWGLSLAQTFLKGKILDLGTLGPAIWVFILLRVVVRDLQILRRQRNLASPGQTSQKQ